MRMAGAAKATPYLRRWIGGTASRPECRLPGLVPCGWKARMPYVLDLGCGNGRNTEYLRKFGWSVMPYDMKTDYKGACQPSWIAGTDPIPNAGGSADLVLCQYLLMFLDDAEIFRLLLEIARVVRIGGFALFEVENIAQGRQVRISKVARFFLESDHLTERQRMARGRWEQFHMANDRCIMRKAGGM